MQDVTNPISFPSCYRKQNNPFFLDSVYASSLNIVVNIEKCGLSLGFYCSKNSKVPLK